MTLYLENTSKNKVITLRYGSGNNKMLQLNPGEKKILPLEITKYKLKTYLHLFKDLKVVEDLKEEKENNEKMDPKPEDINDSSKKSEEVGQNNKEEQSNNISNESEDSQGEQGQQLDQDSNNSNEVKEDSNNSNEVKEDSNNSNEVKEDSNGEDQGNKQPTLFTQKELNALKAEEIKELAKTLDIEVTENSTKKGLIPVILDKQGKLE